MAVKNLSSSFSGLVSSYLRLQVPSWAGCIAKVDVDGFSMANMQDAIRLGGEPRSHSSSSSLKMFLQPLPSCGRRYVPVSSVVLPGQMEVHLGLHQLGNSSCTIFNVGIRCLGL